MLSLRLFSIVLHQSMPLSSFSFTSEKYNTLNINKIIRKGEEFIKYLPIIRTGRTLPSYFLNKNVRNYKFIHWLFVSLCIPAVFVHSHQNSMLKFHFHCNTVKRRAFHEVFRFWEWHSYGVQPSAIGESLLLQGGDFILDI